MSINALTGYAKTTNEYEIKTKTKKPNNSYINTYTYIHTYMYITTN